MVPNDAQSIGGDGLLVAIRKLRHRMPQSRAALVTSATIVPMRASIIACKFGLAIFIGRYLDLASLGLYGLFAGAIAIVPVVVSMGLVHVIMREAVTLPRNLLANQLRHYWSFVVAVYGVLLAITAVAVGWFGASPLLFLVLAIILFEHLGNDVFQLFTNLELPIIANVSTFVRGAAWILVYVPLAIAVPELRTMVTLLGFWLAGSAASFLLFVWASRDWPWKATFAMRFRPAFVRLTIKRSFIIYVSDLAFIGSQFVDRYLVTLFLGLELTGVYFLYWSVANAVTTLVSITTLQVQRPRLIKAHHDGGAARHREQSGRFLWTTSLATAAFIAGAGAAFVLILPVLKQPAVADHLGAFWLIMAGMAARNLADFGAMALFTARRDGIMTLTNVVAVVALIAAQAVLLPLAGLIGAGVAILLTFATVAVWRFVLIFAAWPRTPITVQGRA